MQGSLTSGQPWAGRSAHGARTLDPPWAGCSAHGVPTEGRPTKAHRAGLCPQAPLGQGTPRTGFPPKADLQRHTVQGSAPRPPWAACSAHGVPTEGRPTKAHRAGLWPQAPLGRALRARSSHRRPTYKGTPCRALPPGPPWAGHSTHGVPAEGRPTKAHRPGLCPQAPLGQGAPRTGPGAKPRT